MPISLSEFLQPDRPGDDRPAQPSSPRQPTPEARPVPPASVAELSALLGELTSEWKGIVDAIGDLKREMADDSRSALAPPAARAAQAAAPGAAAAPAKPRPDSGARPAAAARSTPEKQTKPGVKPAPETAPAASSPGLTASPELERRLGELLKLLKESAVAKSGVAAVQAIEIPKNLTLEIAREVAGRVRETMMENLQPSAAPSASAPPMASEVKPAARTGPKRIPLDDLNAIINQITGQG